jgi:hypothetical protein
MHLALKTLAHAEGPASLVVLPPHGAEGGFDPYQRYDGLTGDNFYE